MADVRIEFDFNDLDKVNKLLKELQKAAKNIRASIKDTGKVVQSDLQKAKQYATTTKQLSTEKKKLTAVEKEQQRIERALEATEAKLTLAHSKSNQKLIEKRERLRQINAMYRKTRREQISGIKSTNDWAKALGSFQFKFNALGNIAANVTSAISRSVRRAVRDAINILKDFDQAMADVRSITGATGKDFDDLQKSAMRLGGSTRFTATEVAKLQKEYAKLGFSTKEIIKAQGATLDLAAATNTELPRAAEVVGITIRQFGLNASEAGRVTDVMAKSFTTSALDMEKFAESMKYVGPAAKASGISLEQTTSYLAKLADAGISGSQAGTALRQIMLALAKESGTFSEKLSKATEGSLDLAGATEEVQRRAATSLLVLKDNIDTIDDYTKSLENAAGAAGDMADVQLDTLAGQLTIVKSAWEGMILAMLNSEGTLDGIKWALTGIIDVLNAMAIRAETGLKFTEALGIAQVSRETAKWAIETAKAEENLDMIVGGFKTFKEDWKGFGKDLWNTIFPKPSGEEAVQTFEDISKLIKQIKDEMYSFTEEDQQAELPSFGTDVVITDEQKKDAADKLDEINQLADQKREEEIKKEKEAEEEKLRIAQEAADRRKSIIKDYFSLASGFYDALSANVKANKEKELSAVENNDAARKAIEEQYAKREKRQALGSAIMNQAEAVTNIWSKWAAYPFVAAGLTALALTTLGAQISVIKKQKFEKGEIDIKGPPHSMGGIDAEIEGGESIINKRSTRKYRNLLDAINRDDQVKIVEAMSKDRNIVVNNRNDPYTKRLFELMRDKAVYGEDNNYYYKHINGMLFRSRKN